MSFNSDWIVPDWPAPTRVKSVITTRAAGVSEATFAQMNLGDHVGDLPAAVAENRMRLANACGLSHANFRWLRQTHGTCILNDEHFPLLKQCAPEADATLTQQERVGCVVMTADCLPVLLCDQQGQQVAAVHAGWRGLASGILEKTVAKFDHLAAPPAQPQLMAFLGPAISQAHFQVGAEVREAFVRGNPIHEAAFRCDPDGAGKYFADLYLLAKQELYKLGVQTVLGGDQCTYADAERFYSYRRDGAQSGRMASLIWLDS
jgi:hypothetical protein